MVGVLMKKSDGRYWPQHRQGGFPDAHQVQVLVQRCWKWGWVPECNDQQLMGTVGIQPRVIGVIQVVCSLVRISMGVMGCNNI